MSHPKRFNPSFRSFFSFLCFAIATGIIVILSGGLGSVTKILMISAFAGLCGWVIWTFSAWIPFPEPYYERIRYIISGGGCAQVMANNVHHPVLTQLNENMMTALELEGVSLLPLMAFLLGAVVALLLKQVFSYTKLNTQAD